MGSLFIIGVKKDSDGRIDLLEVITKKEKTYLDGVHVVSRLFMYNLLMLDCVKIYTASYEEQNNTFKITVGDEVALYGDKFITTIGNDTEEDNLGELPEIHQKLLDQYIVRLA